MAMTSERDSARGRTRGIGAARARVRAMPGGAVAWRVGVTVVGVGVIVVGVVLLPLPGPGWLIIFGGLGILATEYQRAARLLARVRRLVAGWTRWTRSQQPLARLLVGLAALLLLAAIVVLGWYAYPSR